MSAMRAHHGPSETSSSATGWRPHVPVRNDHEVPHLVTMLRRPGQRLSSAYAHKGGPHGVPPPERDGLRTILDYASYCPASVNGTAISQSAMQCAADKQCAYIAGRPCRLPEDTRDAIGRMRRFAFVGLTELWNESVCLFHRLLGGSPLPIEFDAARQQGIASGAKLGGWYDEGALLPPLRTSYQEHSNSANSTPPKGHVYDRHDAVLYAFAQMRFLRELEEVSGWNCVLRRRTANAAAVGSAPDLASDTDYTAEAQVEALPNMWVPASSIRPIQAPPELLCAEGEHPLL